MSLPLSLMLVHVKSCIENFAQLTPSLSSKATNLILVNIFGTLSVNDDIEPYCWA